MPELIAVDIPPAVKYEEVKKYLMRASTKAGLSTRKHALDSSE